jgi:hypothetical protein
MLDAAKECAVKEHEEDASLAWFSAIRSHQGCAWLKAYFAAKPTESAGE